MTDTTGPRRAHAPDVARFVRLAMLVMQGLYLAWDRFDGLPGFVNPPNLDVGAMQGPASDASREPPE